jgi:hypothetical protein
MITVGKLIKALREYDEETEVRISFDSDCCRQSIAGVAHVVHCDDDDREWDCVLICEALNHDSIMDNWQGITNLELGDFLDS